jgi:hypothetical protein
MTHYQVTRRLLKETIEAFGAWVPKAVERLEAGFEDAHEPLNSATPTLPEAAADGQRSRAAKARQIRRRERVIRIFPNEESALRQFLGGGCGDQAWTSGSRYFDMAEYWAWKANTEKQRKEVSHADTHASAA